MEITKWNEIVLLRQLIEILNDFCRENSFPSKHIPELEFVEAHPQEEFISVESADTNSNTIVKKVIKLHCNTLDHIQEYPHYLNELRYDNKVDNIKRTFKFSNNMATFEDIIAICYFYYLEQEYDITSTSAKDIAFIKTQLFNKYCNNPLNLFNENLNFQKIALCFPSIMLWLLKYDIPSNSHLPFDVFPTLPRTLFSPSFLLILPDEYVQESLPLILAIRLATNSRKPDCHASKYLYYCYEKVLFLPTFLKYSICKQLCILVEKDDVTQLVYSPTQYKSTIKCILDTNKNYNECLNGIHLVSSLCEIYL